MMASPSDAPQRAALHRTSVVLWISSVALTAAGVGSAVQGAKVIPWMYLGLILMVVGQVQFRGMRRRGVVPPAPESSPALEWMSWVALALSIWCLYAVPTPTLVSWLGFFATNTLVLTLWQTREVPGWTWPTKKKKEKTTHATR